MKNVQQLQLQIELKEIKISFFFDQSQKVLDKLMINIMSGRVVIRQNGSLCDGALRVSKD